MSGEIPGGREASGRRGDEDGAGSSTPQRLTPHASEIQSYRDLTAWQKAMDLAEEVYRVTHGWPRDELYGLTNQVRRAVVSVPANIAEGKGRYGAQEFLHFLSIARGSLHEMETHLLLGQRLGYVSEADATHLLAQSDEVGRLVAGLIRSLRR